MRKMKKKSAMMKTTASKPKGSGKTMAKDKMTVRETMSEPKAKMSGKRRKAMEERVF